MPDVLGGYKVVVYLRKRLLEFEYVNCIVCLLPILLQYGFHFSLMKEQVMVPSM